MTNLSIVEQGKYRMVLAFGLLVLVALNFVVLLLHAHALWWLTQCFSGFAVLVSLLLMLGRSAAVRISASQSSWQYLLHWVGFLVFLYMVNVFVGVGTVSGRQAALMTDGALALGLFLAGVYTDVVFLVVGLTASVLLILSANLTMNVWFFVVVMLSVSALILYVMSKNKPARAAE